VPGNNDDTCRAVAAQISNDRPQWLVVWGCYTRRFWGFALFEMRPRMVVCAGYPDALLARLDDAERRYRVWPPGQQVNGQ
jgi:hypothetical protein